jgi:hypothetical protein
MEVQNSDDQNNSLVPSPERLQSPLSPIDKSVENKVLNNCTCNLQSDISIVFPCQHFVFISFCMLHAFHI